MKKIVLMLFVPLFYVACSNDINIQSKLNDIHTMDALQPFKMINDSLKKKNSFVTRSESNSMRRKRYAQADAAAAKHAAQCFADNTVAFCEAENWTYSQILSYMSSDTYKKAFTAYVKSVSQSASKKAVAHISGDCSLIGFIQPTTSNTYEDARLYLKVNHISGLENPNNYSINGINLPIGYKYLQSIGEHHNGIILSTINRNSSNREMRYIEEPIGPEPIVPDPIDSLFADTNFHMQYFDLGNEIDDDLTTDSLNYSQLFVSSIYYNYYYSNEIAKLFLNAILYSNSLSDIINLSNSYITVVRQNNTVTLHQKKALYSCFVVAIYSYSLWEDLIIEQIE